MGGCALDKKEPKLISAAPVQEARAPESEPETILEPKGMIEEKELLVAREPEMIPAGPGGAATPAPPTPLPFVEEKALSAEQEDEERAAAIAEKVAASATSAPEKAVEASATRAPEKAVEASAIRAPEKAVAAAAPAAAGETPAGRSHTVAPGESLWKIARAYGVTVADLARENGLSPDTRIKAGRKLSIPAAGKAEPAARVTPAVAAAPAGPAPAAAAAAPVRPAGRPVIRQMQPHPQAARPVDAPRVSTRAAAPARAAARHTVKKGETLSLIARHYRVPMRRIMAANGLKDANKIRSGMTLIIPAD